MTPLAIITPNTDDYAPLVFEGPSDTAASYATLVNDLIRLMHIKEDVQFSVGDALQGVEVKYADRTMQNIADDIGASAASLYSWRDLAECFTPAMRVEYRARGLSFSHLREAYKLASFEDVHDFLGDCLANAWTTTNAAIEVRKRKGLHVPDAPVYRGPCSFVLDRGHMRIEGLQGVRLEAGVRYEITVRKL